MNQTLIKAFLLCSLSWISVSGSEFQTVEVQTGKDATLMCSGMDQYLRFRYWLKLVKGTDIQCVSAVTSPTSKVTYHDGYRVPKFTMSSNDSTISLKVLSVKLNDSGIYYCGFNKDGRPFLRKIHLMIKGSNEADEGQDRMDRNCTECNEAATLASIILRGLTLLLVMVVIGLLVKDRTFQTAAEEGQNPGHRENVASDDLNYEEVVELT